MKVASLWVPDAICPNNSAAGKSHPKMELKTAEHHHPLQFYYDRKQSKLGWAELFG